ncbi:phosphatidylglycerophosphatase A [Wolbachia endosymbiont of Cruorifilaria tuberocauda]|uniref:phosphatidylglycerophosphatase A family protein n=1 Tax=Wolbachia endosymbiont of Cruorifilaria tuberocauda TaxID=1812111 RepID=UPI00158C9738|nr:phosphatidylglycerophosphatase A [Wolbachia endosymbiont of Cruorifilaria tuberocauda]QKX01410.1 phosphatidylglycerophosphatase A [Wolbachia endosymbiont of Cruorifilaria tuberocauda]
MKIFYKLISTWCLSGTVKKMPGTVGSLASYLILPIVLSDRILGAVIIFLLFLIGLWSIVNYTKYYQTIQDPEEVVIDEVVGQLLTVFLTSILLNQEMNSLLLMLCFFSFRLFDIIKTWPINLIDRNIKCPLGIMLDDITAAILACVLIGALYCLLSVYAG